MRVNMKMSGTEEFQKALRLLPEGIKLQVLGNANAEIARGLLADQKANAPVDQGDLKESLGWQETPVAGTRTRARVKIGSDKRGWYWAYVEFGTPARSQGTGVHPGVRPKPFVRPAFDKWKRKARRIYRRHLETAVGVAMRKARVKRTRAG